MKTIKSPRYCPHCLIVTKNTKAIVITDRESWRRYISIGEVNLENNVKVDKASYFQGSVVAEHGDRIGIFDEKKFKGWIYNKSDVTTLEGLEAKFV